MKSQLARSHRLKMFVNSVYVYLIHLLHLVLNLLPGIARVAILRPLLRKCGSHVYIDHNVYIKFPWLVEIGDTVSINRGVEIYSDFFSHSIVKIGSNVRIAPNAKIHAAGHEIESGEYMHAGADVVIGDKVWIGAGAHILQGVVVGESSVVAAGSVVTKDVPAHSLVGGVPAKVIRQIKQ